MSEEQTQAPAPASEGEPTPTPPAETPTAPAEKAAPQAPTPDWRQALDQADPKELRRHPRFAGILGSAVKDELDRARAQAAAEARQQAQREADEDLIRLGTENEDVLRERYPKAYLRLKELRESSARESVERQVSEAQGQLSRAIGRGFASLPEWAEFGEQDFAEITKAVVGITDVHDQAAAVTVRVAEMLAEKRAQKRFADWKKQELAKEREALRKEVSADGLKRGPAPDLARPRGQGKVNIAEMSDKEFDRFWDDNFK